MAKIKKISFRFRSPRIENVGDTEWLIKEIKKLGWVKEDFEIKKHRKKVV